MKEFGRLELIRESLVAVVNEMRANVIRSSYSSIIYEGHDFSCALVMADGRLLAQGDADNPIHIFAVPYSTAEVVKTFEMPGHSIEDFTRKSVQIALSGIYDLRIHRDDVLGPVLRQWGVFELEGLDEEGEEARNELATLLDGLDKAAARFEDKRDTHHAKLRARGHEPEVV